MSDNNPVAHIIADDSELDAEASAMIAAQAPRLFAAVVTQHGHVAATRVVGWGMEFDDSAYMITADGRNQFFLAEAENALMYLRSEPDTTQSLVWVAPATPAFTE